VTYTDLPASPRRARKMEYLRRSGVNGYSPAGPVRERLQALHDQRGITLNTIAERTGLNVEIVAEQYRGYGYRAGPGVRTPVRFCHKKTERLIMSARFTPEDGFYFPPLGIRRRLRALQADGFAMTVVQDETGIGRRSLPRVMSGTGSKNYCTAQFARRVIDAYDRLSAAGPTASGVSDYLQGRARRLAVKKGYAPSRCWDDDTIDDPEAFPEWTGSCGTIYGRPIHLAEGTPICDPCKKAAGTKRARKAPVFSPAKFRKARIRAGLPVSTLAKEAGLDAAAIAHWEAGRSVPKLTKTGKIQDALIILDVTYEEVCE
jgi:DNA-binding XRE family transcriptional regulator